MSYRKRPREGDLLAVLSHELRSPLNAILVWTRLLRGPDVPEERRKRALEAIERNVRHQADLLDDLAELQRIRAGKVRLEPEPVDFGSVTRVVAESLEREARERGVHLRFDAAGEPLSVFGDPGRLQRVVRTLLGSVTRFASEGGRVEARVGRAGSDAELVVCDLDGVLPADLVGRLSPRLRAGALRGTGGAGVALAVAEELVRLHHGFVGVEQEAGGGVTIRVRVPLDPGGSRVNVSFLKGLRVLVVDDEPEVCRSLEELLTSAGAHVRTAVSVGQGLAAGEVDAVVTDVSLPGSGYALLRAMRARYPEVPVIALTAAGGARRTRGRRFDAVLQKPVEPERLLSVLGRAFARSTPPPAGGGPERGC